jgi:FkbM family methyltransferase
MPGLRRTLSDLTVALGRRLFANTPVQQWPATTMILRRVLRLGYGSDDVLVQFRGMTIAAPAGDVTILPGILGGFYEKLELDVFTRVAAACSLVVDVGGNIGIFACAAATSMPNGRVISFEPVPANLAYLRRNLVANEVADRVEIVEQAVSDTRGSAPIYLADSIGTHSLASANAKSARRLDVSVTTLDDFLGAQAPELLKIDVEGLDARVLRGGRRMLEQHKPTLFVEYTPVALAAAGSDPAEMLEQIFSVYDEVYLVEEPRSSLARTSRLELAQLFGRRGNWNLIAVADRRHLSLVRGVAESAAAHGSTS